MMLSSKLFISRRILSKNFNYRVKLCSSEVPKPEDVKCGEKRAVDEKPSALLTLSASAAVPRRLYSSEAPPKPCGSSKKQSSDDKPSEGGKKCLVLGVYECDKQFELTPAAEEVNQKSGGKLCQHLNELSCRLKLGEAFVVTDVAPEYAAVALASLGPKDPGFDELEQLDLTRENIRVGVGAGVRALSARAGAVLVDPADAPGAAAEAAELAAWRFQEFKSCGERLPETRVYMYGDGSTGSDGKADAGSDGKSDAASDGKASAAALWREGVVRARAQNWARFLSDMPANNMTPTDLAQAAIDKLCPLGVRVEARNQQWAEAQRMEAFLTVARGSCAPPLFLECEYRAAGDTRPPVLLVAKGVTYDSGGMCLKSPRELVEARGCMAGAAVALAALKTLATLKVPINVVACIPLCENMVSGQCMKVGDVVRALNGLSIQIEDTDMEGRLMMADALVYGQALHKPALVVDVATLTHGVALATGGAAFGCFARGAGAWRALRRAGALSGDRPWRLPLWDYYQDQITDNPAVDLRNRGSGTASPCIGAAFLKNFVCGDWLHLDITGVGRSGRAPPYLPPRRATGRPTRTLALALQHLATAPPDTAAQGT